MSVALMEWMFSLAKDNRLGPLSSAGMYRKANYKVAPVKSCPSALLSSSNKNCAFTFTRFSNLMRKIENSNHHSPRDNTGGATNQKTEGMQSLCFIKLSSQLHFLRSQ